ncbi:MAG: 4-alpha-glucanotransferase [Candidatus Omnitrophica bacterium]|jgi:4-alpha-glucanotransferase|nr:4-alpha-glucanotransferase [Candidatus Omnitrophota bacterium]
METYDYSYLLSTPAGGQWQRIGARRRAGVIAPLFSIFSKKSTGIGEIPDLALLADWCVQTGQSLIELLPMQDVGFDFCPYDAVSSFALEPMHLRLDALKGIRPAAYRARIQALREKFPTGGSRVNYEIKAAKLALLWDIFKENNPAESVTFKRFAKRESYWLTDYALYKVIRYLHMEKPWPEWSAELRDRDARALEKIKADHAETLLFHQWLQWQLWEQMRAVRAAAAEKGVYLIGDLPFLVSRHSADVWARPSLFKLDRVAGAPPDYFIQTGQRWGMPPFNWEAIAADDYRYLKEKLRYAQEFYDLYRIDHAIGMFRIWTIRMDEPVENGGKYGSFDPPDERDWEAHGSRILTAILANTRMLPCAEDLGVVPACSNPTLRRFGLPGMDIQRWRRDPKDERRIVPPEEYRTNSIASLSTHDMIPVIRWWRELSDPERGEFSAYFGMPGAGPERSAEAVRKALETVSRGASIFSVQSFQDWFSCGLPAQEAQLVRPTNVPGTFDPQNWSWVSPYSLEDMTSLGFNSYILDLNRASSRI